MTNDKCDKKAEKAEKTWIETIAVFSSLLGRKERVMGLEPTTAALATRRSTTELHPRCALCRTEPSDLPGKFR